MAGLEEIAIGLAQALASGAVPNPLPVELRNQTPQEAAFLVKRIVQECQDAGIALDRVRLSPTVGALLSSGSGEGSRPLGVTIEQDAELGRTLEFWRADPTGRS